MKYEKTKYEDIGRIKAENRAKKIAFLATLSDEDKRRIEEQLHKIAKDFQGWSSRNDKGEPGDP